MQISRIHWHIDLVIRCEMRVISKCIWAVSVVCRLLSLDAHLTPCRPMTVAPSSRFHPSLWRQPDAPSVTDVAPAAAESRNRPTLTGATSSRRLRALTARDPTAANGIAVSHRWRMRMADGRTVMDRHLTGGHYGRPEHTRRQIARWRRLATDTLISRFLDLKRERQRENDNKPLGSSWSPSLWHGRLIKRPSRRRMCLYLLFTSGCSAVRCL